MTNIPSDAELAALANEVDSQLNALQLAPSKNLRFRSVAPGEQPELPAAPQQQAVIEQVTGEPFETFWQKYKRHARRDLCLPGGLLFEQWHKWKDLQSKDSVKIAFGILAGMAIPTASIAPAAVAVSVFLLNVIAKVGIEAVCEECTDKEPESKPR